MKYYVIVGKTTIYYGNVTSTKHELQKVYKFKSGKYVEGNSTTNDEVTVFNAYKKGLTLAFATLDEAKEEVNKQ